VDNSQHFLDKDGTLVVVTLSLVLAVHFPWPTMEFEWCGAFIVDSTGWSDRWCCLLSIEGWLWHIEE